MLIKHSFLPIYNHNSMPTKLTVLAKPFSKINQVEQIDATTYLVRTTAPAQKGRANQVILKLLAKHLNVSRSRLLLTAGAKSPVKEFLLLD